MSMDGFRGWGKLGTRNKPPPSEEAKHKKNETDCEYYGGNRG